MALGGGTTLSVAEVVARIEPDRLCLVAFVDESRKPAVSAASWVRGRPPDRVDVVVGWRARLLRSVSVHPEVVLVTFSPSVLALSGQAYVVDAHVPKMPLLLARLQIRIEAVRSAMFTGGVLVAGPLVTKAYPPKLAGLDALVSRYLAEAGESVEDSAP
jgi:hypothetical protein